MIDLFTKQEKIFISFLLFAIIIGAGIEIYKSNSSTAKQVMQSKEADETLKQVQEKAILIDSMLQARALSFSGVDFSAGGSGSDSGGSVVEIANKKLSIEINTATVAELEQLPQIGPVLADRIVKYRNVYGAFKEIEEITNVKGIGTKKLSYIKPYIYIKGVR